MTEKKFFPMVAMWQVMPRVMGAARRLPWICTDDLGAIAAKVFADPPRFIGQELTLASNVQALEQCRTIYRQVMGRNPPHFPLPSWLFRRFGFVGRDLTTMWRWLGTEAINLDTAPTHAIHPDALTVHAWLSRQKMTNAAPR